MIRPSFLKPVVISLSKESLDVAVYADFLIAYSQIDI